MNLLEAATISYGVNVLVADADEDAATFGPSWRKNPIILPGTRLETASKKNMFQTTSQRDRYLFNVGALRLASVGRARAR